MKTRYASAAVTAFLTTLVAAALSSSPVRAGGTIEAEHTLKSKTLGRVIPYRAYRPDASTAAGRKLPVLYLLHGRGDDENAWIDKGGIGPILDRAIAAGKVKPLIVVMPAAGNSWYVDDMMPGRFGNMSKALTTDLVDGIEARYPIARCRQARAVGGLSMGGYGAMLYALDRPDLFASVFSLSGSLFSEASGDIERRKPAYERIYGGVFGSPFDEKRFLAWNVFMRLDRPSLRHQPLAIWLSAGDRDFPSILDGTVRMHNELGKRSIPSELHIMKGEHTWELWNAAVEPALEWLSDHLASECPAPSGK